MITKQREINPPDLSTLLRATVRAAKTSINCIQIGEIQAFNQQNQTATIKVAMKLVESIATDETRTLKDYPLLLECPVFILNGGGDAITMPISKGDECIILFNDRQLDEWLNFGSGRAPSISRVHDISDAMALVGISSFGNAISDYFANGIRIQHADGSKIEISDDLIESTAENFNQEGNLKISDDLLVEGGMTVLGDVTGNLSEEINIDANIVQPSNREIHAGNGATGTFTSVTVVDGIVIGGS